MKHSVGNTLGPNKHTLLKRFREVSPSSRARRFGIFECSACHTQFKARIDHVLSGNTQSCGCLTNKNSNSGHGLRNTLYYTAWQSIKQRCYNPNLSGFKDYGGRGIKMCKRWANVSSFKEDIDTLLKAQNLTLQDWGKGKDQFTLDRKNNDGDYEPNNVRFATRTQQANNRRHRPN